MNVGAAVLIGALIYTLTELFKAITGHDWIAVKTQVASWVIGAIVVLIASNSSVLGVWKLNGVSLQDMDVATKVAVGLLASSLFGVINDIAAAIDNTRTSRKG